jgi:serine/threonine protein kinase
MDAQYVPPILGIHALINLTEGTARWKAPELLNGAAGDLTTAVDVYAFAITCIEIMSMGGVPWGSMEDSILCHRIVGKCSLTRTMRTALTHSSPVENLRPPIPQDFRTSMLDGLFDTWWHRDPHHRPEFKSIVDCVQDLIEESEEGALEDIRRKTHRLSLSPQPAHSPEFPPVSKHLAMTFEQSPIASASSRESSVSFCR